MYSTQHSTCSLQRRLLASKVILFLTVLLLLVTPLTSHLWSWDGFLRGGTDMELGLLSLLEFCALVVLMAQHVIASPFLSLLLSHPLRRPRLRTLLQSTFGAVVPAPLFPAAVERCIDRSVPLSLLSLRI